MSGLIRTAVEEVQAGEARYYAPLVGEVSDVVDKMGLHRVRVRIAGFAEGDGIWCFPEGGGAPGHGAHLNAKVGQEVIVQFVGGDPHGLALWRPGKWATRPGGKEVPDAFRDLSPEDASQVHALEVDGFTVAVDARPGKRQLVVSDDRLGSRVQLNGEIGEVSVVGCVSVTIEAPSVKIKAASLTLNGRTVLVGPGPIG